MKDKTSIINVAQKYAAKGQLDKAIAEWKKLLDSGKDGNVHNTIGDLYFKKGSEGEALESYSKAAEIFKSDGFFPKATAIYKKILHIVPNDANALIALAKLDAEKGLTGNAVENYLKAAEVFKRDGNSDKTMKVVEKILELSPSSINIRLKVADLYLRSGLRENAVTEYINIASAYIEKGDTEKAHAFFTKAIESDSSNIKALIGLSKLSQQEGNIDQAFEYLRTALSHHPDDKETLLTYAGIALESKRIDHAKRTLLRAKNVYPSDIQVSRLMGELNFSEGELDKAWDDLLPSIDESIEKRDWDDALQYLTAFRKLHPEQVIPRLVTMYKETGDTDNLVNEIKDLAIIKKESGAQNEALELYKDLLDHCPGDESVITEINMLETALGIAPIPSQQAEPADIVDEPMSVEDITGTADVSVADISPDTAPGENLISPDDLGADEVIMSNEHAAVSEDPAEDDVVPSDEAISDGFEITFQNSTDESFFDQEEVSMTDGEKGEEDLSPEVVAEKKAEAAFFAQQGITDEAIKIYEQLASAYPDDEEVKKELAVLRSAEGLSEEIVIEKISPGGAHEEVTADVDADDLQEMFDEFESSDEENYDHHFRRGKELKQKGNLIEAIQEFQIAAKDPQKKVRNSSILALCYMEKGDYPLAIDEFSKVLELITPADKGYCNVKYEMARAYMGNNDYNKALELYSDVNQMDPEFKDVAVKVDELKTLTTNAGAASKAKRDRVSYI